MRSRFVQCFAGDEQLVTVLLPWRARGSPLWMMQRARKTSKLSRTPSITSIIGKSLARPILILRSQAPPTCAPEWDLVNVIFTEKDGGDEE